MTSPLPGPYGQSGNSANLADILERVLDKGVVIAGDIRINLLDIELLTIKLRLIVASVDKAKEMGIDWWEHDPALSSGAKRRELAEENERLRERIAALEEQRQAVPAGGEAAGLPEASGASRDSGDDPGRENEREPERENEQKEKNG
ncbi:gas vesicle protein [Streptomyces zingiberis]|uniref:gas vesicle protein n=1 Tax=Streptomyces zingiberis TaxID=2053010 RepID=UPI002892F564|nr:gas vesicle protein [Streptomyces zingiberis]